MNFKRLLTWLAVAAPFVLVAPGNAQVLAVQPVNVYLHAGEQATTLGVTNESGSDASVQVRPYSWAQRDGVDALEPAKDLLVSPPIATIPAHGTQIIRIVQRDAPTDGEHTYRILVDQIPSAASAGMIRIVLRLSIPVFCESRSKSTVRANFRVERSNGKLTLVGVNSGNRHDSLQKSALYSPDGLVLNPVRGASPYLLPGSTQRWVQGGSELPESVKQL